MIPGRLVVYHILGEIQISLFRIQGIFNASDLPFWNIQCQTTRKEFGVFYTAKRLVLPMILMLRYMLFHRLMGPIKVIFA